MEQVRVIRRMGLLGLAEVAQMLGISKAAVTRRRFPHGQRRDRVPFPAPAAELACGPIWVCAQIERYLDDCTRGPAVTAAERARRKREATRRLEEVLHAIQPPTG